jgi:hypothetical protein
MKIVFFLGRTDELSIQPASARSSSEPTPGTSLFPKHSVEWEGPKMVGRPRGSKCGSLILLKLWPLNLPQTLPNLGNFAARTLLEPATHHTLTTPIIPSQLEYRDVEHPNYVDFVRLNPTIPHIRDIFIRKASVNPKTFHERWKLHPLVFHGSHYHPTPHHEQFRLNCCWRCRRAMARVPNFRVMRSYSYTSVPQSVSWDLISVPEYAIT